MVEQPGLHNKLSNKNKTNHGKPKSDLYWILLELCGAVMYFSPNWKGKIMITKFKSHLAGARLELL